MSKLNVSSINFYSNATNSNPHFKAKPNINVLSIASQMVTARALGSSSALYQPSVH